MNVIKNISNAMPRDLNGATLCIYLPLGFIVSWLYCISIIGYAIEYNLDGFVIGVCIGIGCVVFSFLSLLIADITIVKLKELKTNYERRY